MALTLRELLDKQRAEREARERGGGGATPVIPVATIEQPTKPDPVVKETAPVASSMGRGLLSRLSQPKLNGGDAAGTANTIVQSVPTPQIASPIPAPVAVPIFTEDETAILRKNLAFLAANLDEKEVIPQVLRTTVKQIQEHPELNAVLVDSDFDLIIAAARRSMKYAQRKKEDKADGRAKKKNEAEELKGFLKDAGIDLDF